MLTPHDGEFSFLAGHRPGADRIEERPGDLAANHWRRDPPQGPGHRHRRTVRRVLVSNSGDERLATAGALAMCCPGAIGALLVQQVPAFHAAAAGARSHGAAAHRGPAHGLVASDLPGPP